VTELIGRRAECGTIGRLVAEVRAGESRALVVHGEPGVGKTVLLDYLVGQAPDCRLVRAVGVQSEIELAFAALHQLCAPLLDRLEHLPVPQRAALQTAFGMSAGPAPDRFLIGLAVLNMLSDVAEERPLVCLIDDEQWLDQASAQVLAFVARRLGKESVGLVFSARVPSADLAGLPELVIGGLREDDARQLLDSVLTGPLDPRVRDQIVAETQGNPLALLELPRQLELAAGEAADVPRQALRSCCRRAIGRPVKPGGKHLRGRCPATCRRDEQHPYLPGQAERISQQYGGVLAGGAVDASLQVTDRPGAQARSLGQFLLGQPGLGPELPQQPAETLKGLRHRFHRPSQDRRGRAVHPELTSPSGQPAIPAAAAWRPHRARPVSHRERQRLAGVQAISPSARPLRARRVGKAGQGCPARHGADDECVDGRSDGRGGERRLGGDLIGDRDRVRASGEFFVQDHL
jgi:hypothetical protein